MKMMENNTIYNIDETKSNPSKKKQSAFRVVACYHQGIKVLDRLESYISCSVARVKQGHDFEGKLIVAKLAGDSVSQNLVRYRVEILAGENEKLKTTDDGGKNLSSKFHKQVPLK